MSGLMSRLVTEWEDSSATPHEFFVEGDRVVVFRADCRSRKPGNL
jgi:ketosteroid isomerase-like protein